MAPVAFSVVSLVLLLHVKPFACEKPNIVFVIADDLGWNDVGFHQGDMDTPNLDTVAGHGVILSRHYGLPLCTPSRTALMTGDYPIRHGMQGTPCIAGVPDGLPKGVKILPQYFSKLGYKTHLVGKWHLGYETHDQLPTKRGFDTFFGYLNGFLGYWDCTHYTRGTAGRDLRRNEDKVCGEYYGRYLTEVLTEEAVKVINGHEEQDGLLLVLAHAAVHTTHLDIEREAPPHVRNITERGYLRAMIERMDWSVGELIKALNEKDLLNNTIFVFISDNGGPTHAPVYSNGASNWPLRGEKNSVHEGGVRTAALVWSPLLQKMPRVYDQYFHITDWLPTLYAAAGGLPDDLDSKDGIDQWSSLMTSTEGPRDTILININEEDKSEAVIKNNWKLLKHYDPSLPKINEDLYYGESGQWKAYDMEELNDSEAAGVLGPVPQAYLRVRESASVHMECTDKDAAMAEDCHTKYCLFDIINDPTECYNMAANHTDVVADLKSILDGYRKSVVSPPPKYFDKRASPKNWDDYWSPWIS